MAKSPKPVNWIILNPGALGNNVGGFLVTSEREHASWWRKAPTFSFERYETRKQASERVAELTAAQARKLDATRVRRYRSAWA